MCTVAVICEYNPFHRGHLAQLQAIRAICGQDTAIVCLMSGSYVQRGAPAVFDKYCRAAAAADCGADVVLELPPQVALRSAEGYAAGAVEILNRMGGVDLLCFGSETGRLAPLQAAAELLLSPAFPQALKARLAEGISFAAARAAAVADLGGDRSVLDRPNDILAVEYCKALLQTGSRIRPLVLQRPGDYHEAAADPESPSATAVRALLESGSAAWQACIPPAAAARFATAPLHCLQYGERAMLAILRTLPDAAFEGLPGGSEGLWRRVLTACRTQTGLEDIVEAAKSKRYARTRLQRMLLCACLGLGEAELQRAPDWIRLLALSERGRRVLHSRAAAFRLVSGGPGPAGELAQLEQRSDDLYALFAQEPEPPQAASARAVYFTGRQKTGPA